jgi:hypothetical protein
MIYQLPNGRIIELSVEQFLQLDDTDIKDLNGMSSSYSLECNNPFYNLYAGSDKEKQLAEELESDEEFEADLFDVVNADPAERLEDGFENSDDI